MQKNHYIQFETESRDQYYFEKYAADGDNVEDKNDLFIKSVNRLEESLNLFKIWVIMFLKFLIERFKLIIYS